jgi:uncharacterized protein (TIGR02145 family)
MRTYLSTLVSFAVLASLSCSSSDENRNTAAAAPANAQTVVRDIDGNEYRVATIGEQVWMAENLRVTRSPSGQPVTSFFFNDDSIGYATCGRMYTWDVAMDGAEGDEVQGICPDGWHLPSDAEWTTTLEFVEGEGIGGTSLLTGGSTGFDARLCGGADFRGNYLYFDELELLWSSTETSEERAYHHSVASDGELGKFAAMKGARIYVRCVRD